MSETIVACAIKHRELVYTLPKPARHHNILHEIMPYPRNFEYDIQGFITDTGRFVDRYEAWDIAVANDQIYRRCGGDNGRLFSENLW